MLRILIVVTALMIFASPLFPQNTWTKQTSGYNENFKRVVFTDSLYGWIAGDSGLIVSTTNGGNSWYTQNRNTNDYLVDIFFLNRLYGWSIAWRIAGSTMQSIIYSTTNGGHNWITTVYPDSTTLLNTVYFLNSLTGFLGTTYSSTKSILRTTNGGTNWYPANVDSNFAASFPVKAFRFMDASTGIASGGYLDVCGVVWKTTDAGVTWSSNTVGSEPYNSIAFPNSNTVVIAGGDYEYGVSINYSTNRGADWSTYFTGYFGIGYSLSFRTNTEGWISTGFSQMFLKTANSGATWINENTPDSTAIYSLTFPNQRTGWAVGDNGAILKFSGNPIGIINTENNLPGLYSLSQNYPNPYNHSTVINYRISLSAEIKIKVFDVMGKEVAELVNKRQLPGTYRITFNEDGLPSGVYYCRLIADNNVIQTRKMVLMK
jgi:photosystem II stability/assembly factor-like uncharacterized protein